MSTRNRAPAPRRTAFARRAASAGLLVLGLCLALPLAAFLTAP
jgi:hypothetical protein